MKVNFRKIAVILGICILLSGAAGSVWARAELRHNPFIDILVILNSDEELAYASLFAKEGGPSTVPDGDMDRVPEEVKEAFLEYSARDDLTYVEDIWVITRQETVLDSNYMPPESFKLVIYEPATGEFLESDIYERYAPACRYVVKLWERSDEGKLILEENRTIGSGSGPAKMTYDLDAVSMLVSILIAVLVELGIGFLFKFRNLKAVITIALTNIVTLIYLNLRLNAISLKHGMGSYFVIMYAVLELEILIFEAVVYILLIRRKKAVTREEAELPGYRGSKYEVTVGRVIEYVLVANLVSFLIGMIASMFI